MAVDRLSRRLLASVRARDWARRLRWGAGTAGLLWRPADLMNGNGREEAERQRTRGGGDLDRLPSWSCRAGRSARADVDALIALAQRQHATRGWLSSRELFAATGARRALRAEPSRGDTGPGRAQFGAGQTSSTHAFGRARSTPEKPGRPPCEGRCSASSSRAAEARRAGVAAVCEGPQTRTALKVLAPGAHRAPGKAHPRASEPGSRPDPRRHAGDRRPKCPRDSRPGLAALPVELTPEQASQAVEPMLAAMQGTTNPDALRALGQGLTAVFRSSSPRSRRGRPSRPSLPPCRGPRTRMPWRTLRQGSPRSRSKLTAAQAREAIAPILAAMAGGRGPVLHCSAFSQGLAARPVELTAAQARRAGRRGPSSPRMETTAAPFALEDTSAEALAALPVELHRRAGAARRYVRDPRRHSRGPRTRMPCGPSVEGLGALASQRSGPTLARDDGRGSPRRRARDHRPVCL